MSKAFLIVTHIRTYTLFFNNYLEKSHVMMLYCDTSRLKIFTNNSQRKKSEILSIDSFNLFLRSI